jgi:hypothetical protein
VVYGGARGQNGASLPPYTRLRDPKIGPTSIYQTVSEKPSEKAYEQAKRLTIKRLIAT